ncbi:MAG: hypothetical protein AAGB04_17235, partial [Pseudomonadota bacterium]
GNAALLSILESDDVFFLEPTFERGSALTSTADTLFLTGQGQIFGDDIVLVDSDSGRTLSGFASGVLGGLADLEFVGDQLYGIARGATGLFRISPAAGSVTEIGNPGVLALSPALFTIRDTLYLVDDLRVVYEVNQNTGFATSLGVWLPALVVTEAGDSRIFVLEETLRDIELHTIDLTARVIVSTQTIPFQTTGSIIDMALTKNGLIAVTLSGTLIRIDTEAGTATPFAAVTSDVLSYEGMAAGER